jgi:hypothetical protein
MFVVVVVAPLISDLNYIYHPKAPFFDVVVKLHDPNHF